MSKRAVEIPNVQSIIEAVHELRDEFKSLRLRLTGDADLQTKGLISEVSDLQKAVVRLGERADGADVVLVGLQKQADAVLLTIEEVKIIRFIAHNVWALVLAIIGSGMLTALLTHCAVSVGK